MVIENIESPYFDCIVRNLNEIGINTPGRPDIHKSSLDEILSKLTISELILSVKNRNILTSAYDVVVKTLDIDVKDFEPEGGRDAIFHYIPVVNTYIARYVNPREMEIREKIKKLEEEATKRSDNKNKYLHMHPKWYHPKHGQHIHNTYQKLHSIRYAE